MVFRPITNTIHGPIFKSINEKRHKPDMRAQNIHLSYVCISHKIKYFSFIEPVWQDSYKNFNSFLNSKVFFSIVKVEIQKYL